MDSNIKKLVRASIFLAIAIAVQVMGRTIPQINQFLVGPIINAILLLCVYTCGVWWGASVGVLTPIMAWLVGQLPGPLAPFIPFVIISNTLYVIFFAILKDYKKWGKYLGVLLGSFLKFIFLSLSASKLVSVFQLNIAPKIAKKLIVMMSTPQLITAIIGGAMALIIINILTKRKVVEF